MGPQPISDRTPRPSRRRHRGGGSAPRALAAVAGLAAAALLGVAIGPTPSQAARLGPPSPTALTLDATAYRGCKPPVQPTPTPIPTASPSSEPSVAPPAQLVAAVSPAPTASPAPTPTRTPRPTPTPYIPPGIDVSHWNGELDYAAIVAKGMKFVFIKASQGTDMVDSRFSMNVKRAREAGLVVGAYHFFDYTQDGLLQAEHFVATARSQGMVANAMPLSIDVECLASLGWAVWAKTQPRLRAMVDRVWQLTGRRPIIYTSRHMWGQVMGNDPTFGDLPLWVACWRCDAPYIPVGWGGWRFWQIRPYKFPAIGKTLDGNIFKGTDATLLSWRGAPVTVNGGDLITGERLVAVDLSTFTGAEVRTGDDVGGWGDWRTWSAVVEHRLTGIDGDRRVDVQVRRDDGLTGPELSDRILLDTTGPKLGVPRVSVRRARIGVGGGVPVKVTWTASDAIAGVASSSLVHSCGAALGGEPLGAAAARQAGSDADTRRRISGTGGATPSVQGRLLDGACAMTVRGQDVLGNQAEPAAPRTITVEMRDLPPLTSRATSGWTSRAQIGAVGGSVLRTAMVDATVRVTVVGDELAIVATRGPGSGRFKVTLDGALVTTVDLYARTTTSRSIVAIVPLPKGSHRVRLTALSTKHPRSSGKRVELDAFVVHRAGDAAPSLTALDALEPSPTGSPAPTPAP